MPIIKSAKKRVRLARKASIQNLKTRRSMRDSIKKFQSTLERKKDTTLAQSEAFSAIDTAAKKGIISKNKAARKKSQLNAASKAAGTTKVGQKATKQSKAKPVSAAKTSAAKKTSAKKTPAKKAAANKPAAKKAPTKKAPTKTKK